MPRKNAKRSVEYLAGGADQGGAHEVGGSHLHRCYYLVTIKCNHKVAITRSELDAQYNKLVKKFGNIEWSSNKSYEEDSCNRIHLHTTCILTGNKPLFKLAMVKGWTINFTEYPEGNHDRVSAYINKHSQSENAIKQLFDVNPYKLSYMFS